MAKRLFDFLVSSIGLIVASPLFLAIALAVKLTSPGPILFRQERVGQHGQSFFIRKFRTMVDGAESEGLQLTVGADPRITGVGRFLRRSKLDELPQLIDVLQGNMSIVGPRPEVPRYVNKYPADIRRVVLSVKPGITDEASIHFRDESWLLANYPAPDEAYERIILPRKLEYYVEYASNRSLSLDISIVFRTLLALFNSKRFRKTSRSPN